MNFSQRWLLLPVCLAIISTTAAAAEPVLSARPGLCILQEATGNPCVMAVELQWSTPPDGGWCLYQANIEAPLHCWEGADSGSLQSQLSSREDVSYWLQRVPDTERLAEISVRVVSLAQRNPERRRRRHVWSVL